MGGVIEGNKQVTSAKLDDMAKETTEQLEDHQRILDQHGKDLITVTGLADELSGNFSATQSDMKKKMAALKQNQNELKEKADSALQQHDAKGGVAADTDEVVEQVMAKVRPSLRKIEKKLTEVSKMKLSSPLVEDTPEAQKK